MKIDSIRDKENCEVIAFLEQSDAYRRTKRFEKMLSVYETCLTVKAHIDPHGRANVQYLKKALDLTRLVNIKELSKISEASGRGLRKALTQKRIECLGEKIESE